MRVAVHDAGRYANATRTRNRRRHNGMVTPGTSPDAARKVSSVVR
jgi:hypothetical protein